MSGKTRTYAVVSVGGNRYVVKEYETRTNKKGEYFWKPVRTVTVRYSKEKAEKRAEYLASKADVKYLPGVKANARAYGIVASVKRRTLVLEHPTEETGATPTLPKISAPSDEPGMREIVGLPGQYSHGRMRSDLRAGGATFEEAMARLLRGAAKIYESSGIVPDIDGSLYMVVDGELVKVDPRRPPKTHGILWVNLIVRNAFGITKSYHRRKR